MYKKDWTPTTKISSVINMILTIMRIPDMDSPIEAEVANEYKTNYQ